MVRSSPLPGEFRVSLGKNWLIALTIPAMILGYFSTNILLTIASIAVAYLLIRLFWRPGEPPILLYAMGYQWIQANILIFYADGLGLPLTAVDESRHVVEATWLTLLGLVAVAYGIHLSAGKSLGAKNQASLARLASRLSVSRLFTACLLAILVSNFLAGIAFGTGGLAQPILALANLHWAFVYLFAYTVMAQRRGYPALAVIFGLELLMGFLGFFSDFKAVLIVVLLAALATPSAFRGIRVQVAATLAVATLLLGLFWTAIKTDYRAFLNQGTSQQVVLVPIGERIDKLAELMGNLTAEKLVDSSEQFMRRLTYVHFFGEAIKTVPSQIPHENGKLWIEAINNAIVPRLLNPSKANLDDSVRTIYYTGEWVGGADWGTSVSLGYVAESYIDFGPFLMFLPLLLWGLFVGFVYRVLIRASRFSLLGYACATVPIFMNATLLETSNTKMLAGLLLGFLVTFLALRLGSARLLRFLLQPGERYEQAALDEATQQA